jgi:secreted trypsin-like serine protease
MLYDRLQGNPMKRPIGVLFAALAVAMLAVGVARAITYGDRDGNAHPYVALVALYKGDSYTGFRCSGALISPTVVVTAAHCVADAQADRARVHFESNVDRTVLPNPASGLPGTLHAHEAFTDLGALPNTSDLAVVVLDAPTAIPHASLARIGALNGSRGRQLTVVGYGLQGVKPRILDETTRFRADPTVKDLDGKLTAGWNVQTTNSKKNGGTCFGDSGAPLLLQGTDEIVAINSFGKNDTCKGSDYSYRVDTAYAQSWLAGFLAE